jgi:trk system potassium uptake protein TrkA
MRVLIAGGGRLGAELSAMLEAEHHEVTIIECDDARAAWLGDQSTALNVVAGDACEPALLEHAGALRSDVLVAVTGTDEDNLVISLLAKRFCAVPRVVARVNEAENRWLFTDEWGVDAAVCASDTLRSLIAEAAGTADTISLLRLAGAGVNVMETTLAETSQSTGRAIAELALPTGMVVAAVIRNGVASVPSASFHLRAGDEVLVVTTASDEATIRAAFQ